MSGDDISLDDLLAAQSSVLNRIARDLEEMDGLNPSMAGHNSTRSGHTSSGTHTSHTSGVSSATTVRKMDLEDPNN